ncbi:MAG: hypothetical protein DWG80_03795, partial [Chloroflexi bacterium]|nr:hypothetical protein [Chloroflexota bacterium]
LALPGPTAASDATAAEESLPGTAVQSPSSDGVRGITAGLGAITGLLTALSALLAWNRRQQETPSSSQG